MKFVSSLAIAASLIVGGAAAAPAIAQDKKAAEAPQRKFDLSKEARPAIIELEKALKEKAADFPQKLAAAQAVAKTKDDKYVIAKFQLERALQGDDKAAQTAAVQAILASGGADAAETKLLQEHLTANAINSGDHAAAEAHYAARMAADPNDLDSVVNLARTKIQLKKEGEALELLQRAIALSKAAGKTPEESWYRNALGIAYKQNNAQVAGQLAQEVLKAYPSKENFRNLIAISTPAVAKDPQAYVDLLRLMRESDTMQDGNDYVRLAEQLEFDRFPGEAKAVLEAGQRAGKVSAAQAAPLMSRISARIAEDRAALPVVEPKARSAPSGTIALSVATAYAGYGDYAKAIEFYRLALQKGGVDANLVNTRLGIAYALAGQKAEAEAAFRAVTGLRSQVAGLWMAWLAQRG